MTIIHLDLFLVNGLIEAGAGLAALFYRDFGRQCISHGSDRRSTQWFGAAAFVLGLVSLMLRKIPDGDHGKLVYGVGLLVYHVAQMGYLSFPFFLFDKSSKHQKIKTSQLLPAFVLHTWMSYEFFKYVTRYGMLSQVFQLLL